MYATTWTVTEGQLVRLCEGRPEQAWEIADAPREAMMEALEWDDHNGEFSDLSDADLRALLATWGEEVAADDYYVRTRG